MTTAVEKRLAGVKNIVVVLSGKGGVGKSTVACQLALTLAAAKGLRVGILDVDICGPSVPKICGVEDGAVVQGPAGWAPATLALPDGSPGSLSVMSIAFLLASKNDAVVWRGPRKDAVIQQFLGEVEWGALDYLIIDTPPGTSDEHISLCEALRPLNPAGAVIVTTPQDVSLDDVRKMFSFCTKLNLKCIGVVENMSGYVCPHCAECTNIFGSGGGMRLAAEHRVPFLGSIPIDPALARAEDEGMSFLAAGLASSPATEALRYVVGCIEKEVAKS